MYITREDNVALVQRPNHSHVTQFEDGTRFTVCNSKGHHQVSEIMTECNGFARVHYTASPKQCCLRFPDNSIVTSFNNGSYRVKKQGQYSLHIQSTGEAQYKLPHATYALDHTKRDNVLYCKDSKENVFSMNYIGEVTAEAPNSVMHKAFLPRYFVLCADSSAYELHRNSTIEDFVSSAKSCLCKVVVKDTVPRQPDISTTTVIEPVYDPRVSPVFVALKEDSIVPHNLRCGDIKSPPHTDPTKPKPKFGTLVGKGLTIGSLEKPKPPPGCGSIPVALEYRQFLHMQPLTDGRREEVYNLLATFIHQSGERMRKSDAMQPVEKINESEIRLSNSLQEKFLEFDLPNDISSSYKNGLEQKFGKSATSLPPNISQVGIAFIEQSKSELEKAEDIRASLRNKIIPPYFKSEQCKKYPLIDCPDMEYLSSKVPGIVTMSRSTLHSSSISLPVDDSESVSQGECAAKEIPKLCSPGSTQAQVHHLASQTAEVRPNNPTPFKAALASQSLTCNDNPSFVVSVTSKATTSNEEREQPTCSSSNLPFLDTSGTLFQSMTPSQPRSERPGKQPNVQVQSIMQSSW